MKEESKQAGTRRTRKKDALQRHIIDTALRVFADRGIDAATMETLADAADISKATLYRYFPVKEAVLAGYWQFRGQEKEQEFESFLARNKTTRKRLTAWLETNLAEAMENADLFAAYLRFRMQNLHDDQLEEQLRSGHHAYIERILSEGVSAGEIRADIPVRLLAVQFALSFFLLFSSWRRHPEKFVMKKAVAGIVELYITGAGNAR